MQQPFINRNVALFHSFACGLCFCPHRRHYRRYHHRRRRCLCLFRCLCLRIFTFHTAVVCSLETVRLLHLVARSLSLSLSLSLACTFARSLKIATVTSVDWSTAICQACDDITRIRFSGPPTPLSHFPRCLSLEYGVWFFFYHSLMLHIMRYMSNTNPRIMLIFVWILPMCACLCVLHIDTRSENAHERVSDQRYCWWRC